VTWNPYPPLPVGALTDLLGITRALYRATLDSEPRDSSRLQAIEVVGKDLRAALRLTHAPPGTIDHGTAWAAAERAARGLSGLVEGVGLAPVVAATARLVTRPGSMV
jgi:hypothetical protein